MTRLLFIVLTSIFDLHVHVDGPDIHAFRVVAYNTFKHGASILRLAILELKHAEFRDQVHMLVLGKGL